MSSIADGLTTSVLIPIGRVLTVSGDAVVSVSGANVKVIGSRQFGPYSSELTVLVSAVSGASYSLSPAAASGEDVVYSSGKVYSSSGDVVGKGGGVFFSATGSGYANQAHSFCSAPSNAGATKGNTLWHETIWLPCGVDAVQIRLPQNVTDVSTYTGVLAYVQTTDASGAGSDFKNPYMGGVVQSMKSVTWGGNASPTFTNAPDIYTPVGPWSDWIPVNNTGVNGISYLILRQWWPSGVAAGGGYTSTNYSGGRFTKLSALGAGGFTGVAGSNVGASNSASFSTAGAALLTQVRFATQKPVPSVAAYGDSTVQGFNGDGAVSSYERVALQSSLSGLSIAFTNRGASGQTSTQYYNRLMSDIASGERFDVIIYRVASVNDSHSAATSATQLSQAYGVLRAAAAMGAYVIFEDAMPFTLGTPSADQILCATNARNFVESVADISRGVWKISYSQLHNASQYAKWSSAYSADGYHPNELAVSSVCTPVVRDAILSAVQRIV